MFLSDYIFFNAGIFNSKILPLIWILGKPPNKTDKNIIFAESKIFFLWKFFFCKKMKKYSSEPRTRSLTLAELSSDVKLKKKQNFNRFFETQYRRNMQNADSWLTVKKIEFVTPVPVAKERITFLNRLRSIERSRQDLGPKKYFQTL